MKRRIVVAIVLSVLMATSAYAQTTDFFVLVQKGTPQSVQDAIDRGANIKAKDVMGRTALMLATEYNHDPDVIATLLKAGADVNARDNYDLTFLLYAAEGNSPEVITTLLGGGC
jgi:ankyrin repeat protein